MLNDPHAARQADLVVRTREIPGACQREAATREADIPAGGEVTTGAPAVEPPPILQEGDDGTRLQEFWDFHRKNPHIYERFLELAAQAWSAGMKGKGSRTMAGIMHWPNLPGITSPVYPYPKRFTAYYVRLFQFEFPERKHVFRLKRLRH